MKKEKKEAIDTLSKQYYDLSEQHKAILTLAGIDEDEIPTLCSVMDVRGMTDVTVEGILEVCDRQSRNRIVEYGWNGKRYLEAERQERLRMGRKAAYLNELDSDEVRKAVAGFYVATCMTLLVIYMVK